ncbi:MAG: AbrB/MazE/SpoVT family DNA-binding domain-containing protein [Actinomycetota bacterium]|nr:AbrB/MazE/SpoVT family DNA-binding domain-containing protein [Actinomycetota bacterium]
MGDKEGAVAVRFGIEEGSLVIAEDKEEGILIRPAVAVPLETYSQERKAEFLLSNAVDAEDYARAEEEVRKMGLDPATVAHRKPITG